MIFISAQPDVQYFHWQLDVQLFNFQRIGIDMTKVYCLLGYRSSNGISEGAKKLQERWPKVNILLYEDTRTISTYIPSLRPHILAKFYLENSDLEKESLFYHDSDIIFRALPNFEVLNKGKICYLSNTTSYLDSNYINSKGPNYLTKMCEIVGVDKDLVISNDKNAGGAQYLIKKTNWKFWAKVEKDCNSLYDYMVSVEPKGGNPLQKWCADMWAVLYNLMLDGQKIKVVEDLNFSWASSPKREWFLNKIFHNAGIGENNEEGHFCKSKYFDVSPFETMKLTEINPEGASYKYAFEIDCCKRYFEILKISRF